MTTIDPKSRYASVAWLGGLVAGLALAMVTPAWSQTVVPPPVVTEVDMSGPRFGFTMLSQESVDTLRTDVM